MDEKRLTDLELKFTEQEQTIGELSDMVNRQWQEIELLKRKLVSAHDRIISLEGTLPASSDAEKPPHY
ncbi:SlyX family protein [uncultured Sneathiella sp.]|jgi:SlyX protein|uniref:SlyX family protein n=1 Tax=uncultured Sneathiella sp. TaxID=879315 RepID=UPI0030DA155B|tara:strand:+ start:11263 stop:11466 length:204 start_codon:yes stop_codon:yes gene_type:complete